MISFFCVFSLSINCSNIYTWQYYCQEPNLSDFEWSYQHCTSNNTWDQPCTVYEGVECEGSHNFTRKQWCPNYKGANYGKAILLSYFFGILGLDRFYLGYRTVGLIKLCTGGFFFFGYLMDCILITMQIVKPANGEGYTVNQPFPFLTRQQHNDIL